MKIVAHTLTVWSSKTEHEWCPPLLSASAPLPTINITPTAVTKNADRLVGNPWARLAEEDAQRDDMDPDEMMGDGNDGDDDNGDFEGGMFVLREGIAPLFVCPPLARPLRSEAIASI